MLFALGTGTSTGTCIALAPVLYPAGYFLGSDPAMLGLAILSGAAFGDNLAPISDTTIVSAYTQGARMKDVVRSRFPLSITAAAVSAVIFLIFGGGGQVSSLPEIHANLNPSGIFMLVALAVVVVSALAGRHIIESLIYGNVTAAVIGVLIGNIPLGAIFSVPAKSGASTGLIQDGVDSVVGAIIFAILILAVTQILVESGIMRRILDFAHSTLVSSVRQAELFIVGVTVLASHSDFRQRPGRTACRSHRWCVPSAKSSSSRPPVAPTSWTAPCAAYSFTLPWHIAVAAWYGRALQCGRRLRHSRARHQRRALQPVFLGSAPRADLLRRHRLEPQVRHGRTKRGRVAFGTQGGVFGLRLKKRPSGRICRRWKTLLRNLLHGVPWHPESFLSGCFFLKRGGKERNTSALCAGRHWALMGAESGRLRMTRRVVRAQGLCRDRGGGRVRLREAASPAEALR